MISRRRPPSRFPVSLVRNGSFTRKSKFHTCSTPKFCTNALLTARMDGSEGYWLINLIGLWWGNRAVKFPSWEVRKVGFFWEIWGEGVNGKINCWFLICTCVSIRAGSGPEWYSFRWLWRWASVNDRDVSSDGGCLQWSFTIGSKKLETHSDWIRAKVPHTSYPRFCDRNSTDDV